MKKPVLLVAALSVAAGITLPHQPSTLSAQQAPPAIDVVQVAPKIHLIAGDTGNIVIHSGVDGVVVVDSGAGERSSEVLAAIERVTDTPIRFVLNTSASPDRVGGNEAIAKAGEEFSRGLGAFGANLVAGVRTGGAARLAQENVLLRMSTVVDGRARYPESAWPTDVFTDRKEMFLNGETIQMLLQPAAHSNGDSIVVFRQSDVVATGSLIDSDRFPMIDLEAGGSIQGLIDALNKVIEIAVPPIPLVWQQGGTQIVPGKGRVLEEADLIEYRDMLTIVRDVIADQIKQGRTLEQIRASQPTRGFNRRYGADSGSWTTAMFVDAVHGSLTKGVTR